MYHRCSEMSVRPSYFARARRDGSREKMMNRVFHLFTFSLCGLAIATQTYSEPPLKQRMGQFKNDMAVCKATVTHDSGGICAQVTELVAKQPQAKATSVPDSMDEGQPSETCYYLNGKLRLVELEGGELLTDTIAHYYFLDGKYLFVAQITTPHKDFLQKNSERPLTEQDLAPHVIGLLFRDATFKSAYSAQGTKRPKVVQADVDDALSDYRAFIGVKDVQTGGPGVNETPACPALG